MRAIFAALSECQRGLDAVRRTISLRSATTRLKLALFLPDDLVGAVIGRGHAAINRVKRSSQVSLLEFDSPVPGSLLRRLKVEGEASCVGNACAAIHELADSIVSNRT